MGEETFVGFSYNTPMDSLDFYMERCLQLALLGQGHVHPNPMVGCVVLDTEGNIVGEGYHAYYGGPHAEVMALDQAGEKAMGGTLLVNLEPCNHTGKTPPCTHKVLKSGVRRVFFGMLDPNPKVCGAGMNRLLEAGLEVSDGYLEAECQKLNEAFCHRIQTQQPFVIIKQAMTLDGRIATRSGQSQWISNKLSRKWVHQLRAQSDAILTTAKTIQQDNSRLTVRDAPLLARPPIRVILDRNCVLNPDDYHIFEDIPETGPVWLFTKSGFAIHPNARKAEDYGARLFEIPEAPQGLNLHSLMAVLGQEGLTQLLVEAGGHLAGALLESKLANKLWLVYGNQLLLDPAAQPGFRGSPVFHLKDALHVNVSNQFQLENNMLLEAYPQYDILAESNF